MGKLEERLGKKELVPYFPPAGSEEDIDEEPRYEEQRRLPKERHFRKFGFTKDSYKMASTVENDPSPKGVLKKVFCGRPIDVHMLEDYLVWRTSPLTIKTILSYGHSKTIEDMRGLLPLGERARGNSKMLVLIILAIILLVGGVMFLLYGPQLTQMFQP